MRGWRSMRWVKGVESGSGVDWSWVSWVERLV